MKKKTTQSVAIAGLVLVGVGFVFGGVGVGLGALAGFMVAFADWLVIARFAGALVGQQGRHLLTGGMIAAKMTLLLGLCWALLARFGVDPIGFCLGLSSLVLGVLYAGTAAVGHAVHLRESDTAAAPEGGCDATR